MLSIRARSAVLALSLGLVSLSLQAQNPATEASPVTPDITPTLNALADQPATHIGFTLDRSMLREARKALEAQGMSPERAVAALTSVSYDNYRYSQPVTYTSEAMATIVAGYRTAGWKHLVDAHQSARKTSADGETLRPGAITDLWLHNSGADIDGVTVLIRSSKNVNLIRIACDLRPLDLLHLSGHFGIPKIDPSAVMVPDPKEN